MSRTLATIALLTKNAEQYLAQSMDMILAQKLDSTFEALIIDSGSQDQTRDICFKYPVRLIEISPEEFNHGETRNLAVCEANPSSQFIVYLSQDALPKDEFWLGNLLAPMMADPQVAGTFSRHVPRPGASPMLVRQLTTRWQTGGEQRLVKQMPTSIEEYEANQFFYIYFSNTSSAIRREIWQKFPFRQVNFAEDAEWADRVLRAGYKIVFEPSSIVIHSHDYSTLEQFRQNVDHTHAMVELFNPGEIRSLWYWLRAFLNILREVWLDSRFQFLSEFHAHTTALQRIKWMIRSPLWHFATVLGGWVGVNLGRIPQSWRVFFTRQERIKRGFED